MQSFIAVCKDLESKVGSSGFAPECVISIPNGGNHVTEQIFKDCVHEHITLLRPAKGKIKKRLNHVLRHLPLWVKDLVRIMESKMLVRRKNHMRDTGIVLPRLNNDMTRILIVDDAVDSGATLKAVMEKFSQTYPEKIVKSAVITITSLEPVYTPDFYLFYDRTLICSPWAIDMKK